LHLPNFATKSTVFLTILRFTSRVESEVVLRVDRNMVRRSPRPDRLMGEGCGFLVYDYEYGAWLGRRPLFTPCTFYVSECRDNAAVVQTDASFPVCFLNNQGAVVPQSKYCSQPRIASISVLLSAIGTKSLVTADFASAR
jgi:hypothetical protein